MPGSPIVLPALLLLTACHASNVQTDSDGSDGSGGSESEIVIPMRPRDHGELYAVPEIIAAAGGEVVRFDTRVVLAIGEGYPPQFTASLPRSWFGPCGSADAPLTVEEIGGANEVVAAELIGGELVLTPGDGPGTTTLIGTGEARFEADGCGQTQGSILPLELSLTVQVIVADDAVIESPCGSEPTLVAPSTASDGQLHEPWFTARLRDEGEPVVIDNAERQAQLTVRLRGRFDGDASEPASLEEWVTPSEPQLVEIAGDHGAALRVDVVDPSRVTAADVQFQIAGFGGGPLELTSGGSYGPNWARVANRLAPTIHSMSIGSASVCSRPGPDWFELTTRTPANCELTELDDGTNFLFFGHTTGIAARLRGDGACELELQGPGAVGRQRFSGQFTNVDGLNDP